MPGYAEKGLLERLVTPRLRAGYGKRNRCLSLYNLYEQKSTEQRKRGLHANIDFVVDPNGNVESLKTDIIQEQRQYYHRFTIKTQCYAKEFAKLNGISEADIVQIYEE